MGPRRSPGRRSPPSSEACSSSRALVNGTFGWVSTRDGEEEPEDVEGSHRSERDRKQIAYRGQERCPFGPRHPGRIDFGGDTC